MPNPPNPGPPDPRTPTRPTARPPSDTAPSGATDAHGARSRGGRQPGDRPLPDYVLVRKLGRGGYGEVWQAHGPGGFPVALKFIALDEKAGEVELRALDTMRTIRHLHLLGMFGSWQHDGELIVAMELADGTLHDRLNQVQKEGLPGIPAAELLPHLRDAAEGLDYLNSINIQHRDVKPQNLLLVGGRVKVGDFGLVKVLQHSLTGHTGAFTPAYAAPEFLNGKTSSRSDQYSLAVAYCQMRAGRRPYEGQLAQVLIGHAMHPPDLSRLPEGERPAVARALAKEPGNRWENCLAFVRALVASQGRKATPRVVPPRLDPTTLQTTPDRPQRRRMEDKKPPFGAEQEFTNSLGMRLKYIPRGTFRMGSPETDKKADSDERKQHPVKITRPFYMAIHTVTVEQFRQFVKEAKYKWKDDGQRADHHPIVNVSWHDAIEFCKWLSRKEGRAYDLPTEAEWEYSCRAGTQTAYYFGDDAGKLSDYAWYDKNAGSGTHEVGLKKPNAWGLFDMHGNVWQWCADSQRAYPSEEIKNDIKDPFSDLNDSRVLRGGSWIDSARGCRAACRDGGEPGYCGVNFGFRVVVLPSPRTS
jgi:formylglycine-generating enzyme required for sulfatase activity